MSHTFLTLLADLAIGTLVIFWPILWVVSTDRFRHPPQPQQYAALFLVAGLAGVFLFLPTLSIIAAAALLAYGTAWLYGRLALHGVTYSRTLYPARLFVGDEADLTVTLDNRKILPLAWISIVDPLHYSTVRATEALETLIRFSGGIELLGNLQHALVGQSAVGPFQSLERTYRVEGVHRGVYTLGPAEISASDPFGLFRKETILGGRTEIIVYPRIYNQDEIGLPFREAMGEVVTRRSLYEDPTLIAGSREYRPEDELRRMHWKATARSGELQVRVSDPSTTAQIMIVLNLNTFQHVWQGVDPDRMEATINVAASLAVWALDRDFPVGIRSNGIVPGTEVMPRVAASAHPRQSTVLLEHLARIAFSGRFTPEEVLLDESRRLAAGTSIVFVTPVLTPALISLLTSRKLRGRMSVVYCGRFAAPVVRGLPIQLVTPPLEPFRAVS